MAEQPTSEQMTCVSLERGVCKCPPSGRCWSDCKERTCANCGRPVSDHELKEPITEAASRVANRLRHHAGYREVSSDSMRHEIRQGAEIIERLLRDRAALLSLVREGIEVGSSARAFLRWIERAKFIIANEQKT